MSYCVSHGKDKVIFATDDDLKKPSSIVLPEDEEPRGFLLPNGEINWGCPCLGSMVVGPCSVEFRDSISCFHNSTAEPKGSDCLEQFRDMNDCMSRYPNLYKKSDEENENSLQGLDEVSEEQSVTDLINGNESTTNSELSSQDQSSRTENKMDNVNQ
ncbi:mitochondrial intermembrane space import and assembly protein 40-B-like [Uloborus diversus]|uniref:mitochondrial intermembrane space import and assembly protein 40-B-like n=1 Tax=Uloborus diversus TaxID=327109 RepID=UPI002409AEF0|nr:mitochondrial intermembrane space import and assembly protein 40-B-like [Uloborus diversus]